MVDPESSALLQVAEAPRHVLWVIEPSPVERVAYVSPSFERIWGRPVAALYADPREWVTGVHPDDRERIRAAYDHWVAAPHERTYDIEFRVVRPDGAEHWIHDTGHAVVSASGALQLTGIAEDITERRRDEECLREQQRYFREMTESLTQLIWATRPDGHADYFSPQWVQYTGVPAEQQHGDGWLMQVHPDDRPAVAVAWRRAVSGGDPYAIEMRLRRHDGVDRWFMARGCPLRAASGEIRHWYGTSTDIDDLKCANAQLQRERDRFEMVAKTSPSAVHTLRRSADGRYDVTFGIERFADMYGMPLDQIRGDALRAFATRIHPDDLPVLSVSVDASWRQGTPWRAEYRVLHPERGQRWIEAHSMPLREPDGATVWHGTLTDVTERREAEARIRSINADLEARVTARTAELQNAVQELEAFSYSVSHDLRAPLRAIDGFSQVVLKDYGPLLPETGQRYLNIIRDSAQKMGQLIDDLLAFSRLGRQAITRRPVDTSMIVREALETLAPMRQGRSVDVCIGELPPSDCDPAMLRQVWINLLSNALKYTRNRSQARVEVGFDGPEFFVRDNGTGFDMKYAHKLFHVFERLHRVDEFEGTGVGLAIVQRIVERHGGAVRVEAAPNQGAAFYFRLGETEAVA
ncbi:MAG: PAS domain-containing protein [Rhizobacter sp.]